MERLAWRKTNWKLSSISWDTTEKESARPGIKVEEQRSRPGPPFCIYGSIALVDLDRYFSFLFLYALGRTPWMGDQLVARPLHTQRTIQTHNKRTQTSMHWVGFEPKITVFEGAKTVHASYRAATAIGTPGPTRNRNILHRCHLNHREVGLSF
jgi:hypothetical protein